MGCTLSHDDVAAQPKPRPAAAHVTRVNADGSVKPGGRVQPATGGQSAPMNGSASDNQIISFDLGLSAPPTPAAGSATSGPSLAPSPNADFFSIKDRIFLQMARAASPNAVFLDGAQMASAQTPDLLTPGGPQERLTVGGRVGDDPPWSRDANTAGSCNMPTAVSPGAVGAPASPGRRADTAVAKMAVSAVARAAAAPIRHHADAEAPAGHTPVAPSTPGQSTRACSGMSAGDTATVSDVLVQFARADHPGQVQS
jgi:hypothetical protein